MLRITPEAGLAIQRLVAAQGGTVDGGLRIDTLSGTRGGEPEFTVSVAVTPDEFDLVATEELTGARVLLDSLTAEILDDGTLDVDDTVESQARFRILPRPTD